MEARKKWDDNDEYALIQLKANINNTILHTKALCKGRENNAALNFIKSRLESIKRKLPNLKEQCDKRSPSEEEPELPF